MFDIILTPDGGFAIESAFPIHAAWTQLSVMRRMMEAGDDRLPDISDDPRKGPALDGHIERLHNRLLHALKRLKSKGLYADTLDKLYIKMAGQDDPKIFTRYQMYAFNMDPDENGIPVVPLSDDVWCSAIEMTMLADEFDIYANPDATCTPAIYDHVTDLWFNVAALATGRELVKALKYIAESRGVMQTALDIVNSPQPIPQASTPVPEPDTKALDAKDAVIRELREQLEKERRGREKDRLGYERHLRELRAVNEPPEEPEPAPAPEEPVLEEAPVEPVLHDLPDTGIIFVGGDHNLQKRMKLDYPGWTFISKDGKNFQVQPTAKAIFIWANQVSHTTQFRLDRLYGDRIPRFYVTKTNAAALDTEMTHLWSDWMEKTSSQHDT